MHNTICSFGVCCIFTVSSCGAQVSRNCSYLTNPGFPATHTGPSLCQYFLRAGDAGGSVCLSVRLSVCPKCSRYGRHGSVIMKCSLSPDVCSLRLDFETFTISGPLGVLEVAGGACAIDSFTVAGASPTPVICGENSGQHSQFLMCTSR